MRCMQLYLILTGLKNYLKSLYKIERTIAINQNKLYRHDVKWGDMGRILSLV